MTLLNTPYEKEAEDAAIDILARTVWGEARTESVRVKEALAALVLNRVRLAQDHFGKDLLGTTVVEACMAHCADAGARHGSGFCGLSSHRSTGSAGRADRSNLRRHPFPKTE
jgi:hypothetical protein